MREKVVVISIFVVLFGTWWLWETDNIVPTKPLPLTQTPTTTTTGVSTHDVNVYRNEDWGFQFEYPEDWKVKENTFRGYYTQFSAVVVPLIDERWDDPVLIHIVDPQFVENSFKDIDKTEELVKIDGVEGVKYVYDWKSDTETVIILPIKEYKMILGTNGHYPELYNEFLESFKFVE